MNGLYDEIRIALHGVWRRRWVALAVAWGLALIGWTAVALIPNSYESKARVSIDTNAILPGAVGITGADQQRGIDQVRQTLTSTINLQKVVRGTDLALQAGSPRDMAVLVERLRKDIDVKAQQDNLFEISARVGGGGNSDAQNARIAKAVVGKLIDLFVEANLASSRDDTNETIRFLDQELARRQQLLQAAQAKQVEFQSQNMGLLPGAGSASDRLLAAQTELGQVESGLMAAQSSATALSGQLASTPASTPLPGGAAAVGGTRGLIADLQGKIAAGAAEGWTDRHPDMVAMRAQVARLQPQAAREGGGGGGGGSIPNPMYVTLRSMLADKQASASALAARKAQLQGDIAQFTARQSEEPGVAAQQAQLSRDYDVQKAQYDKMLADRQDVQLRSDVASKTDSVRFTVIDPPSDPRVPVAPKRPLLLAGVLLLALGAGVGAAFGMSKLALTFPTAERLAGVVDLPVLGSVGEVLTDAERATRTERLKWFAGGVGGLAACFALLLVIEFVQRGLVA